MSKREELLYDIDYLETERDCLLMRVRHIQEDIDKAKEELAKIDTEESC